MRPKTFDNDFSREKKTKAIIFTVQCSILKKKNSYEIKFNDFISYVKLSRGATHIVHYIIILLGV